MGEAVLIVEDDQDIRDWLALLFRGACGVQVFTACHAKEGIEVFRANPEIGAILCDNKMGGPGLDGDDLHRELAEELRVRRIHFVLVHGGSRLPSYFQQVQVAVEEKPLRDLDEFVEDVVKRMRELQAAT
ncbi:MAG: response regulator [Patescibacteria group bacterium]